VNGCDCLILFLVSDNCQLFSHVMNRNFRYQYR
jgi:hypothetical protein